MEDEFVEALNDLTIISTYAFHLFKIGGGWLNFLRAGST
jgi:hypothetical protein